MKHVTKISTLFISILFLFSASPALAQSQSYEECHYEEVCGATGIAGCTYEEVCEWIFVPDTAVPQVQSVPTAFVPSTTSNSTNSSTTSTSPSSSNSTSSSNSSNNNWLFWVGGILIAGFFFFQYQRNRSEIANVPEYSLDKPSPANPWLEHEQTNAVQSDAKADVNPWMVDAKPKETIQKTEKSDDNPWFN